MLKRSCIMVAMLLFLVAACSNKEESTPPAAGESKQVPAERASEATNSVQQSPMMAENTGTETVVLLSADLLPTTDSDQHMM